MIKVTEFRNPEGYSDPTAYEGLKPVIAEDEKKERAVDYAPGTIHMYVDKAKRRHSILVLSAMGEYATGLMLAPVKPEVDKPISVATEKGTFWADAGRTIYVYYDAVIEHVGAVTAEQLDIVRGAVADALGLRSVDGLLEGLRSEGALDGATQMATPCQHTDIEFEKLITERDIYRDMYNSLISRIDFVRAVV